MKASRIWEKGLRRASRQRNVPNGAFRKTCIISLDPQHNPVRSTLYLFLTALGLCCCATPVVVRGVSVARFPCCGVPALGHAGSVVAAQEL